MTSRLLSTSPSNSSGEPTVSPKKTMQRSAVVQLSHNESESERVWAVGENQPLPFPKDGFQTFTPNDLNAQGSLYSLLISTVIPRPIALVTSMSKDGALNCAPYSYFNLMSHDPPLVTIGMNTMGRTRVKKDTLANIEETGK